MEETIVNRVTMTTRVDPKLKRRFRRECKRRKVRVSWAMERAINLLFAEWEAGAAKTA